ncbi:MAG: DUF896 domain-containing protein [Clostridia bacterium]|nr:DUF896 domain-containing protein [Clostridia bacterium]
MLDIKRINELYKKQKEVGLTEEEKKEQALLRRAYIDSVKASITGQLGEPNDYNKGEKN